MCLNKFRTAIISKTIYFITCMQSFERKQRRAYGMYAHFRENGFFTGGTTTRWRIQDFESDSSNEEDHPYLMSDSTTTESEWEVSEEIVSKLLYITILTRNTYG